MQMEKYAVSKKRKRELTDLDSDLDLERPTKIARKSGDLDSDLDLEIPIKIVRRSGDKESEKSNDESSEVSSFSGKSSSDDLPSKDEQSEKSNDESLEVSSFSGNSSKDSDKSFNEENIDVEVEGGHIDFQTPENMERGTDLLFTHTQTYESHEIGNYFPEPIDERAVFMLQNRVIDYNVYATRANISSEEFEDGFLESYYLNFMEDPQSIIQEGIRLIQQVGDNPQGIEIIQSLISVIGVL